MEKISPFSNKYTYTLKNKLKNHWLLVFQKDIRIRIRIRILELELGKISRIRI